MPVVTRSRSKAHRYSPLGDAGSYEVGYKAFDMDADGNLACRGLVYPVGKWVEMEGRAELCRRGFHYCAVPMDVQRYYFHTNHVYRVLASGDVVKGGDKACCTKIKVLPEKIALCNVSGVFRRSDGTEVHVEKGKLHRDGDEPAVIHADGVKEWWKNGKYHRNGDGPAIIYPSGTKEWWKNGERHRDGDKPAVIRADEVKEWWKNGERHRDSDKPAIIYPNGTKVWWKNGERYRDGDEPTIIFANSGTKTGTC